MESIEFEILFEARTPIAQKGCYEPYPFEKRTDWANSKKDLHELIEKFHPETLQRGIFITLKINKY